MADKMISADKLAQAFRRKTWYSKDEVLDAISDAQGVYIGVDIGVDITPVDEQPTVSGWISVDDATPDKDGVYLTWHGQSPMIQAFGLTGAHLIGMITWIGQKGGWWSIEMNRPIIGITHWMPLPEPPKEDDDADN